MTAADLLNNLREAEIALWHAMRDGLHAAPEAVGALHTSMCVSLDLIEDHAATIRTLIASSNQIMLEAR